MDGESHPHSAPVQALQKYLFLKNAWTVAWSQKKKK